MKPSHITLSLKHLVERKRPVFIWGPPGVGKSDLVAQVANTSKLELRDVRLSLLDPVDLKGFPMPSGVGANKVMAWLPPNFLPTKGKGILFLDELNSAPQSVQAAAYQLVLNRKIGDYTLPAGWAIIAAGNRATDRSVVHAMPAALANRFVHIDFEVDMDDWLKWALANGIGDATRGYIRYRPSNLTTEKLEPGARAFPSPRSWVFADEIARNSTLPQNVMLDLLKGTVGEGVAAEYIGFLREQDNLPNIDMILIDPDKVKVPDSIATRHALISVLEKHITPNTVERLFSYVKRMSKEFEVVFLKTALQDPAIQKTPTFLKWVQDNRSVLLG